MAILITDWASVDQVLPIASKYGAGLEFQEFTNPENLDNADRLVKTIKNGTENLLLVSMHGPFFDLAPASRDPLVRRVAEKRFGQAYDIARLTNAQHLILHSGFFLKTDPSELWLINSYSFWMNFLLGTPESGFIHIENVYEDDYNPLLKLVDRVDEAVGAEKLTICLDVGHVNANSSKSIEVWVGGLGDRIRYVHLHNNGGLLDDHWRLDHGKIDIVRVLDLLSKHAPHAMWCVETQVTDIEPSLLWLQDKGYL